MMAPQVRVPATKQYDLNLTHRTHSGEEKNSLLRLSSQRHVDAVARMHTK